MIKSLRKGKNALNKAKRWPLILFGIGVFYFSYRLVELSQGHGLSFIVAAAFIALVVAARQRNPKSIYRYIFSIGSALIYIGAWNYFELGLIHWNKVSYMLIIFYAYLLPDIISANIVGLMISGQYLTYRIETPGPQLLGHIFGAILISISYSVIYQLLRNLTEERNLYREMSIRDSLTGVYTLDHLLELGQGLLDAGTELAVFVSDLDRFKQINDTYGHLAGNLVLVEVAKLLQNETAEYDRIIGRLGGDEFVILINGCSVRQMGAIGARLTDAMDAKEFVVDSEIEPIRVSFSLGSTHAKAHSRKKLENLLSIADIDMYYNKYENHRRNVYSKIDYPLLSSEAILLLHTLAEKDMYTYVHSEKTARVASGFARYLGLEEETAKALYVAGWLHDIGKLIIPNDIIRKTGALTDDEYFAVKQHVNFGISLLSMIGLSEDEIEMVRCHHQRWDGKGYPRELSGTEVSFECRILQIADAFSAMSVKRVYRPTFSLDEAIIEIQKNAGMQFDPELAKSFIEYLRSEYATSRREVAVAHE